MKKTLVELVEELVSADYEVEKLKYTNPRRDGWIHATYALAYGVQHGYGKKQLATVIQSMIDKRLQELSDLSAKVEAEAKG